MPVGDGLLPLPGAGLMSNLPHGVIGKPISAVRAASELTGISLHEPVKMLAFLFLLVILFLKLMDCGLVDVLRFKIIV